LLFLSIALAAADDGRHHRDADLQLGEVQREQNEVLDAAHRPPMARLGDDAIRFSTAPALGGTAYVVEIVSRGGHLATVRAISLEGHERWGWHVEERLRFDLSSATYRRLASRVDAALARAERAVRKTDDESESYVCMDGPGYLTERSLGSKLVSLAGFCGPDHPNRDIAVAILGLLCSRRSDTFPGDDSLDRLCVRRRVGET
jgi:hypothetical protein